MESRIARGETVSASVLVAASFTVIASIVPEILTRSVFGAVPGWLPILKVFLLLGGGLLLSGRKLEDLRRYAFVLALVVAMQALTSYLGSTGAWRVVFDRSTFVGSFGGDILLKVIGILPVVAFLLYVYRTPERAWLGRGDLSVKAERIGWLGITKGKFTWGRLSLISAFLISMGTLLLTGLTATGFSRVEGFGRLATYLPLVLLLALVNSFCEGVMFRSAVLATLSGILPKNPLILTGALLFGIGHYYGIPSGPLGAVMSSALGWYMLRSMYETRGFLSSWFIHFMQDLVIFSTVLLMTGA